MKALMLAVLVSIVACGSPAAPSSTEQTINVFAAASLTDSFRALGEEFHRDHPNVTVRFNFAGTPTLVTQIEQGAEADVFASADTANMDRLSSDGIAGGTPLVFAHNKLEIIVAKGNPKHITGLADLAKPDVIYISAGPTVPAGKYALQSLQKAGVTVTPKSLEADVKSVVSKIELGEADAGIVYATDVKAAGGKVEGVQIADNCNVVATYPLTVIKHTTNAVMADEFITYVLSTAGQATLKSFGFLPA